MAVPVMKPPRDEASVATMAPKSAGSPNLRAGTSSSHTASASARESPSRSMLATIRSSMRSVANGPGHRQFTMMFSCANSIDSDLARPTMASRSESESTMLGCTIFTPTVVTNMMRPPPAARMCGSTARERSTSGSRISLIAVPHASRETLRKGPEAGPPVLPRKMSRPPNFCATASTEGRKVSCRARSIRTPIASEAPTARSSCTSSSSTLASRPATATFAPSAASASAEARPRPREAAVTRAHFPFSPRSMDSPKFADRLEARRLTFCRHAVKSCRQIWSDCIHDTGALRNHNRRHVGTYLAKGDIMTAHSHFIPLVYGNKILNEGSDGIGQSIDPSTGAVIAEFARAGAAEVDAAVAAAREAFDNGPWRRMRPFERGRAMQRVAALLLERRDDIARLESTDSGKPLRDAYWEVDCSDRTGRTGP